MNLRWTQLLLPLALVCGLSSIVNTQDAQAQEALPANVKIVALVANPPGVRLQNKYDYTQLLLTARTADGGELDVTRLAKPELVPSQVAVSARGVVTAKADGAAELVFSLADQTVKIPVEVTGASADFHVNYIRDVMPAVSKMGCNAGTCHGSKDGKNGFKLSLRGYDPIYDTRALTDDLSARRINRAAPENSLMLLKATGAVPHVGGQVTKVGEPYYEIVKSWIAEGMPLDLATPRVQSISIEPKNPIVQQIGAQQQMRVLATYTDGTVRDVTLESFIDTGNQDVAKVDPKGLVNTLRRGEAPILARFEGAYIATTVTVMGNRDGFAWKDEPANNEIDNFVYEKLKRMKTLPSELCTDDEFLRRVYLDVTGLPPSSDEVRAFLADMRESRVKRDEVVDRLVGSASFVEHWTNKWADLLQVNRKYLGEAGSAIFRNWIKQALSSNMPYDKFVYEVITASGSNRVNPAAAYFKVLRTPDMTMENTTHLFLAVRFNCNKCHDHPFERWTQDQYYHLAAFFAQTALKTDPASSGQTIGGTAVEGAKPLYEIVFDQHGGEIKHDRTGEVSRPEFPYVSQHESTQGISRREELARWITSPDNQYFAKSYVNRLWGYMLGVGIIEPIDDIRAGNPPTNPELLDWLTKRFIENGFNMQEVMKTICKSRTYQRSISTNEWNADDKINFSHGLARRLPAEVLYDTVYKATGTLTRLPGLPDGMRAAELVDAGAKLESGFLDQLGRPARESACECERATGLMLGPVMALVNGPTIAEAISDPNNEITRLTSTMTNDEQLVDELFMRILNRAPTAQEKQAGIEALTGAAQDHQKLVAIVEAYKQTLPAKAAEFEQSKQAAVAAAEAALKAHDADLMSRYEAWQKQLASGSEWTVLTPSSMTATNEATLTVEDEPELLAKGENGSIIATGKNGKGEYKLTASTDLVGITGFRLEVLADDRLPGKGPGRAPNGNFVLHELSIRAAAANAPMDFKPMVLKNAQVDFAQAMFTADGVIDGSAATGWAVHPETGKSHVFIAETAEDIGTAGGTILNIILDNQYSDGLHTLGRFRLSVTTAPRPLRLGGLPEAITAVLAKPAAERTESQAAELLAFYRGGDMQLQTLTQAIATAQAMTQPEDSKLKQLETQLAASAKQVENQRLVGAQDLVWALLNSPAFLFNR